MFGPASLDGWRSPGKRNLNRGTSVTRRNGDRVVSVSVLSGNVRQGKRLADHRRIRVDAKCLTQARNQVGRAFIDVKAGNSHLA
jgi:hypothetical protein